MKILKPGHVYELANHENPNQPGQELAFIQKVKGKDGKFVTFRDGTTNEEVVDMLLDRILGLNDKLPCPENGHIIKHLQAAREWMGARSANRQARGVEGTPKA